MKVWALSGEFPCRLGVGGGDDLAGAAMELGGVLSGDHTGYGGFVGSAVVVLVTFICWHWQCYCVCCRGARALFDSLVNKRSVGGTGDVAEHGRHVRTTCIIHTR